MKWDDVLDDLIVKLEVKHNNKDNRDHTDGGNSDDKEYLIETLPYALNNELKQKYVGELKKDVIKNLLL